jgi:hypothetical protein
MRAPAAALFADDPRGAALQRAIAARVEALGEVEERASRTQIAYRHRRTFAIVWRPGMVVRSDVPVVLSIALPRPDPSPRWKQVAHPSPRVWMHHLEVRDASELDDEVDAWLREAHAAAA